MSVKRKSYEKAQFKDNLPNIKDLFGQQKAAVSKFFELIDYTEVTALAQKVRAPVEDLNHSLTDDAWHWTSR
eukprot:2825652-Pyramimonas_sp.AAC.1